MSAPKQDVAEFQEHFQSHGKYDYLFGDAARTKVYVELIGTGSRVLKVGCRPGNLTDAAACQCDVRKVLLPAF